MRALAFSLVLLVGWVMGLVTVNCVVQHFNPPPQMPLVHSAAVDCAPLPPKALLPRDHWEGTRVVRSKDGGTV